MTLPSVVHMDVWNLLWIVGVTDFTLKFGTIIIKALIAMLPKLVLPCKKKVSVIAPLTSTADKRCHPYL